LVSKKANIKGSYKDAHSMKPKKLSSKTTSKQNENNREKNSSKSKK